MPTDLPAWSGCAAPQLPDVTGTYVRVSPFDADRDAAALFAEIGQPDDADLWQYIPFGPPPGAEALGMVMRGMMASLNWQTHLLTDVSTGAMGMASYMRIRPEHGSAEVGSIVFGKRYQRTPAATEAMYIMARHLFEDLGYRRYEWKCNDENGASKRAANRLGFTFEGVFRNDMVVKGRNRNTAWYSITDDEWPAVKARFEAWLSPENFDAGGQQKAPLNPSIG